MSCQGETRLQNTVQLYLSVVAETVPFSSCRPHPHPQSFPTQSITSHWLEYSVLSYKLNRLELTLCEGCHVVVVVDYN